MNKPSQSLFLKSALLFLVTLNISLAAQALQSGLDEIRSDDDFVYSHYYMIKVDPKADRIDLLRFEDINQTFPRPAEPYKRDVQYGSWLKDKDSCLNTRAKVLQRDSSTNVTFLPNGCTVDAGSWDDPYTGKLHEKAKDIQIDHVVALKNSYMTGGHEWSSAKRCLYANYMGNNFHLLSVNGPENLKKGDTTPSQYVPPNKAYTCEFLKNWLSIKTIWALRITPKEGDAIQKIAAENNCEKSKMQMSQDYLESQKRYIEENMDLCGGVIPGYKPDEPVDPNTGATNTPVEPVPNTPKGE
ncbi:MAG: hypothetical protein K0R29_2953 [Pseudobdellovibrio sp.]|jgi:hypothetical protein|nr:hypothetical protein [Pseudobdellovibrio sp.]